MSSPRLFDSPIEQTILPSNDLRRASSMPRARAMSVSSWSIAAALGPVWKRLHGLLGVIELHLRRIQDRHPAGRHGRVDFAVAPPDRTEPVCRQRDHRVAEAKWRSDARFYVNYVSRRISDCRHVPGCRTFIRKATRSSTSSTSSGSTSGANGVSGSKGRTWVTHHIAGPRPTSCNGVIRPAGPFKSV